MSALERRLPPDLSTQRNLKIHSDFADTDTQRSERDAIHVPVRTLSPVSSNAMNALNTTSTPSPDRSNSSNYLEKSRSQNTIRSVPLDVDFSPSQYSMPHSTKTLPSLSLSTSHPPQTHQNTRQNGLSVGNGLVRSISSEFGSTRSFTNNNLHDDTSFTNTGNNSDAVVSPETGQPLWSSVGRASLAGKSGKVIEQLTAEKDMLKRDLKLERLRAEESRQSVKMAEESKQAMVQEYESRLHDAAINKTLLKRKERQLADLKSQIEGEKHKAATAVERERTWRDAKERTEVESKKKVEEAQTYAALMEGRVNTMSSHWKDQQAEVQKEVGKMKKRISELHEIRRSDDQKISTLEGLCDQQKEMLAGLERENEAMKRNFQAYKQDQEDALRGIKEKGREQEERNEKAIQESLEVLGRLKWAVGVQKNVDFSNDGRP